VSFVVQVGRRDQLLSLHVLITSSDRPQVHFRSTINFSKFEVRGTMPFFLFVCVRPCHDLTACVTAMLMGRSSAMLNPGWLFSATKTSLRSCHRCLRPPLQHLTRTFRAPATLPHRVPTTLVASQPLLAAVVARFQLCLVEDSERSATLLLFQVRSASDIQCCVTPHTHPLPCVINREASATSRRRMSCCVWVSCDRSPRL